jgi:predicted nucleic acid-binding Zn ribbon protein
VPGPKDGAREPVSKMADESRQVWRVFKRRSWRKPDRTVHLRDVVGQFMENEVSPRRVRFRNVADAWNELLPAELGRHCRISDISKGQLEVLADSPSYAYELQLCSSELLAELQQRCPRPRIKKIKFAVG